MVVPDKGGPESESGGRPGRWGHRGGGEGNFLEDLRKSSPRYHNNNETTK